MLLSSKTMTLKVIPNSSVLEASGILMDRKYLMATETVISGPIFNPLGTFSRLKLCKGMRTDSTFIKIALRIRTLDYPNSDTKLCKCQSNLNKLTDSLVTPFCGPGRSNNGINAYIVAKRCVLNSLNLNHSSS